MIFFYHSDPAVKHAAKFTRLEFVPLQIKPGSPITSPIPMIVNNPTTRANMNKTNCVSGGKIIQNLNSAISFYKISPERTHSPDGVPSLYTPNGAHISRDGFNAIVQNIEAINAVAGGSLVGKTIEIEFDELPSGVNPMTAYSNESSILRGNAILDLGNFRIRRSLTAE